MMFASGDDLESYASGLNTSLYLSIVPSPS
jgi:hypothetical protein